MWSTQVWRAIPVLIGMLGLLACDIQQFAAWENQAGSLDVEGLAVVEFYGIGDTSSLVRRDLKSGVVERTVVPLPNGKRPRSISISKDGRIALVASDGLLRTISSPGASLTEHRFAFLLLAAAYSSSGDRVAVVGGPTSTEPRDVMRLRILSGDLRELLNVPVDLAVLPDDYIFGQQGLSLSWSADDTLVAVLNSP